MTREKRQSLWFFFGHCTVLHDSYLLPFHRLHMYHGLEYSNVTWSKKRQVFYQKHKIRVCCWISNAIIILLKEQLIIQHAHKYCISNITTFTLHYHQHQHKMLNHISLNLICRGSILFITDNTILLLKGDVLFENFVEIISTIHITPHFPCLLVFATEMQYSSFVFFEGSERSSKNNRANKTKLKLGDEYNEAVIR